MELKNNTVKLIRTLPKGRSYTIRCKVVLSFVVGISITGIAQGLEFFSINEVYGLKPVERFYCEYSYVFPFYRAGCRYGDIRLFYSD